MSVPLLSVITINYNDAQGLKKTMDSVLRQTYANFEYIVIDGNSTDTSVAQIKTYADNRLRWISEPDSGIYNAMNKGILLAKGAYVLFVNSGDYLISSIILEEVISLYDFKASFIGGNLCLEKEGGLEEKKHPEKISFNYLLTKTIYHPATFIKKELFDRYGLYNEHNKIISDWEFFFKTIGLNGESFHKIDKAVTVFDMNGISSNPENEKLIQFEKNRVLQKYLKAMFNSDLDAFLLSQIKAPSKRIKLLKKIEKSPLIRKVTTVILTVLSKLVK
ncbi:MAG: glycosyltransferase [Flavobacteriaceae bacterium]|nr:glycosyltransferase [Flavobacteriaceae bacterium]